jgi:hypothetical protein
VAGEQGPRAQGRPQPQRRSFYRSDQVNFAKAGIPALYLQAGTDYVRDLGFDPAAYKLERYHQVSDEVTDAWDFRGVERDMRILFETALRIANGDERPRWVEGHEFEEEWKELYGMTLIRRRGVELGKMGPGELVLTGVATYKLSRVITKSWIGTAIRAPFTRYVGQGDGDEVNEVARGHGVQEAVGDLVTCPFCTAHWVASALVLGHDVAPGPTRAITRILAVDAVSDTLQYVRGWMVRKTTA